ncbi:MAG: signal peptide peptidase SppA [Acidobacteria bacterium]|nr:signal peptide peptidase SppA [Acidobacteriota bacterium]
MSDFIPPPPTPTQPPYVQSPGSTKEWGSQAVDSSEFRGAPRGGFEAPPRRRSTWFWVAITTGIVGVVVIVVCVVLASTVKSLMTDSGDDGSFDKDSIAVVDVSGVIADADKIDSQLQTYGDSDDIKAIVLHINSPGGGAAASQEIYHEVLRVRREKHKKIVASVESVGASGAYYIASACDKIYANPASVVGSIGVIMEWTNYGDLMRWAKLKNVTITRGDLKDAGDPTREMTPKEEAYFQSLVDNMYGQFVHDVAEGRHMPESKVALLATGQVWTGEQAVPLGLIDAQGGYRMALVDTARSVGINGEPNIVEPSKEKHGLLAWLSGNADDLFPNPTQMLNHSPGFYFLWK